jgi:cell wall-associated NlpC family hydrolase
MNMLKLGSRGADVRQLQTILINKGFPCGRWGADGDFGPDTRAAVLRYQTRMGLEADGIVGPRTWAALKSTANGSAAKMADVARALVTASTRPRYVFAAEAKLTDPHPEALDCSELVQWAAYQAAGRDWVDGSVNQYAAGQHITVAEALHTKGALLFLTNGGPLGIHHVAISMGDGSTAEARSAALGTGSWPATGRGWSYACKIPVLTY